MLQAKQILQERYQLQQPLGRTAIGRQTWLAVDLFSDEQVVIKLLAFSPQMQWKELKLFERETQVLANLHHLRIPRYRDYFTVDEHRGAGLPWFALVQSYIPGTTLQELLAQNKNFTETQIKKLAVQVLEILIYLHQFEPPVLHRDIKPSNLIWGEDDEIYLVDFGAVQDETAFTGVTFTVVGTCGYAPLEQFWGKAVPASDLYALGATLIHLVTGIAPADLPQKDYRIQFADLVSLRSNFINWIENLVEPAVEKRFSSAEQALEILESGKDITRFHNIKRISKPAETCLEVSRKIDSLEIQVPTGTNRKLKNLNYLNFSILLSAIFLSAYSMLAMSTLIIFAVPFLCLLWVAIVVGILTYFWEKTRICFQGDRFELERIVFNLNYGKQRGNIADILGIFLKNKGLINQVSIHTNDQIFSLGGALSEAESAWLAQEIQDWLNFN